MRAALSGLGRFKAALEVTLGAQARLEIGAVRLDGRQARREIGTGCLGGGERRLELGVAGAGGAELTLGEVARGLRLALADERLLGGGQRALALAVLVVDQALAVGAGVLGLLAGGVALGAQARERVGLAARLVERLLERAALFRLGGELPAQALDLGRLPRLRRLRLLRRGRAGHRQLHDQLGPDLQLGAFGLELSAAPREGGDPLGALPHGPRLVVEHGDEPLPVLAVVEPQHGAHEAAPAQATPVACDLESLAVWLETLNREGRLRGRNIPDDSSHARSPG